MIDMTTWEALSVDVLDDLTLDPLNVRLGAAVTATQPDILHDLFANERALELVEGIVRVGYLTHETPIVLKRAGKLVVVEGNRRVAALKAIQNPHLAGPFQAQITKLVSTLADRDVLRKIEVKRAPSQDAANQLIAALHTGNIRVPWTPTRQAAFFQAQLDAGKTFKALMSQYPTIDVRTFVLRSGILALFRNVQYTDAGLTTFLASRDFPATVLSRIYESAAFVTLSGLSLDERSGSVKLTIDADTFAEMAENIVAGIKAKSINTRSIGTTTSPRFVKLIEDLTQIRDRRLASVSPPPASGRAATAGGPSAAGPGGPSTPGPGGPASTSQPGSSGSTPATGSGATSTAKRRPKPIKYLDLSNLSVPPSFPNAMQSLYAELSIIDIQRTPNVAFDVLRTVLEKTIKAFAESINVDIRKSGLSQKGYVQLSHCLEWLLKYYETNGPKALVQVVRQVQSGKLAGHGHRGHVSSMDHLNAANHNHHIDISPDEVLQCWNTMSSLVREMLKP